MVGVLAMGKVANPQGHEGLEQRKAELEKRLRGQYASQSRESLKLHPVLQAYAAYYKRFDKTYHLQLQLESVTFKEKPIPRVAALVEAMFMAELEDLILTAGHDLDEVRGQLAVEVASGEEKYLLPNGQEQATKPGDMFIHDDDGILSTIIYGPAARARITPSTTRVIFTSYAPAGIGSVQVLAHLEHLKENVLIITPGAEVEYQGVITAG
jgi:DNA/RNA-binding domain of Phe-tRNA-synthetase-like protein